MQLYKYICVCLSIYVYVYMYVCVYIYIYIYICNNIFLCPLFYITLSGLQKLAAKAIISYTKNVHLK